MSEANRPNSISLTAKQANQVYEAVAKSGLSALADKAEMMTTQFSLVVRDLKDAESVMAALEDPADIPARERAKETLIDAQVNALDSVRLIHLALSELLARTAATMRDVDTILASTGR